MKIEDVKRRRNVPCLFLKKRFNAKSDELYPPAVDCSMDCEGCGFDPSEKQRRLETGKWVSDSWGTTHLSFTPVKKE